MDVHKNSETYKGEAIKEYPTDQGPADYSLFVDDTVIDIITAKLDDWDKRLSFVEEQTGKYANAALKWNEDNDALHFCIKVIGY